MTGEQDKAGKEATERLYRAFPEKFWGVPLTKWKDANEFILNGDTDDLKWAALKPQRYSPDNFFCSDSEFLAILREENPYEATPTGHSGIDYMIRGMVRGGVTFIKAPPGTGKSLHPHTPVLKYSGEVVRAIDVQVGDQLMGPDSTPRNVTDVNLGKGQMYRVTPNKGESWECNEDHILSLRHCSTGEIKNVMLLDYLEWSDWHKSRYKLWRSPIDVVGSVEQPFAYAVGVYLGDGRTQGPELCLGEAKKPVLDFLLEHTFVTPSRLKFDRGAYYIGFSTKSKLWGEVKDHLNCRRIPEKYKVAEWFSRQELLAGILDADGHSSSGGVEIIQKSEAMADDICFVARSLGLAAYKREKTGTIKETGFSGTYFRVFISGDFSEIPFQRLKVPARRQVKKVTNVGFKVEPIGEGTYRGIALDGDHLFLLGDFTVTHNTEVVRYFERAMLAVDDIKVGMVHMEEQKSTTLRAMATYELGVNVRTDQDQQENEISDDDVEKAALAAAKGDRTIIFEMRASDDPIKIVEYVRLAAGVYGADFVFVDHVQRLVYKAGVDGATNTLTMVASQLAELGKELNIGIIMISHVNEDGHTKYAKSLEEEAIICLKIERDKKSEDEEIKNTTTFIVEKNRPFSRLGDAGAIYYDPVTTILTETERPVFDA